jgi:AAA15 family ATPase/GTPase
MLIEFKVSNYRSIREEQTFSLVASNSDRELSGCLIEPSLPGLSGVKFLKGAAIYGANASGKSNFIEAISFAANFVRHSASRIQPGDETGTVPFKLDSDSQKKPSVFEITFVADNTRFVFGFSLTTERVIEEYLFAYPKGVPQRWYHRIYDLKENKYRWEKSSISFRVDKSLQEKTRDNSLFLSVGPQFNHEQLTKVFNWFKKNLRFIRLSVDDPGLGTGFTAKLISEESEKHNILNLLQSADIGVANATVQEREFDIEEVRSLVAPALIAKLEEHNDVSKKKFFEVTLLHKAEGNRTVPLDFQDESAGTRRFFSIIGPWTDILKNGYTVFVDEIESSLHPILVKELLRLLLSSDNNPNAAQVVFSTHNPVLLDTTLLRRDQIWFTEKSEAGATHLYALTDFKPRKEEALAKGYLAGRYGAVPFIPAGLKL